MVTQPGWTVADTVSHQDPREHTRCVLLVTSEDDISGVGTEAGFVEGSDGEGGRGPGRPLVGRIWWD